MPLGHDTFHNTQALKKLLFLLCTPSSYAVKEEGTERVINAHQALRLRWQLTFTMLLKRNQVVSAVSVDVKVNGNVSRVASEDLRK